MFFRQFTSKERIFVYARSFFIVALLEVPLQLAPTSGSRRNVWAGRDERNRRERGKRRRYRLIFGTEILVPLVSTVLILTGVSVLRFPNCGIGTVLGARRFVQLVTGDALVPVRLFRFIRIFAVLRRIWGLWHSNCGRTVK